MRRNPRSRLAPSMILALCVLFALSVATRVDAQIVKCVASSGQVTYTQGECPAGTHSADVPSAVSGSGGSANQRALVGSFSGKQVGGPGPLTKEPMTLRVTRNGDAYSFAVFDPQKQSWDELPLNAARCTIGDFLGAKSAPDTVGVCLPEHRMGLFYFPDHDAKKWQRNVTSDYLLLMSLPFGGQIWEMKKN